MKPSSLAIGVDVPWVTNWTAEIILGPGPCPSLDGAIAILQTSYPGFGKPEYSKNHAVRQRMTVREMLCPMCGQPTTEGDRVTQVARRIPAGWVRAGGRTPNLPAALPDSAILLDTGSIAPPAPALFGALVDPLSPSARQPQCRGHGLHGPLGDDAPAGRGVNATARGGDPDAATTSRQVCDGGDLPADLRRDRGQRTELVGEWAAVSRSRRGQHQPGRRQVGGPAAWLPSSVTGSATFRQAGDANLRSSPSWA